MTGRGGEREIGPPSFRVNRPVVRERSRSAKKYFARYPRRGHVTRKRAWIEAQPLFDGVQFRQREDSDISIVQK